MRFLWLLAALPLLGCDVVGHPARGRTEVTFQSGAAIADNTPVNFTVTVRDAEGHAVPSALVTYEVVGEGVTIGGNGDRTGKDGVVHGSLASTRTGEKTLKVTVGEGDVMIHLAPETVTFAPGPPEGIHFFAQPSLTKAGIPMSPAVVLEVLDANGNRATGAYAAYLKLVRSSGGVVQNAGSATNMISAVDGLITFDNLIINKPQTGYALRAQTTPDGSGAADESVQFDVQRGDFSAATSTITSDPTVSLPADGNSSFTLTLTARDAGGNPLDGEQATFSVTPAQGCAMGPTVGGGGNVTTTGADGVSAPPIFLKCTASGAKTVTATVGSESVSIVVSFY